MSVAKVKVAQNRHVCDHSEKKVAGYVLYIWHRLMKREPVRLGDQSLQKCFMAVLFKIRSANVFLVFIFTANWVL